MRSYEAIPDVAIVESSHTMAIFGFGILAMLLFTGLAYAHIRHKKLEREGIYRKYKLPSDRGSGRREVGYTDS